VVSSTTTRSPRLTEDLVQVDAQLLSHLLGGRLVDPGAQHRGEEVCGAGPVGGGGEGAGGGAAGGMS